MTIAQPRFPPSRGDRCLRMSSVRRCDTNRADTQKRARRPATLFPPFTPTHGREGDLGDHRGSSAPPLRIPPQTIALALVSFSSPCAPSQAIALPSPNAKRNAEPTRTPQQCTREVWFRMHRGSLLCYAPWKSGLLCATRLPHNSLQMTAQNAPRTIQHRDSPHNSPQLPPSLPRATECRAHCLAPRPLSATFCGVPALPSRARTGGRGTHVCRSLCVEARPGAGARAGTAPAQISSHRQCCPFVTPQ